MSLLLLLACEPEPVVVDSTAPTASVYVELDAPRLLRRMSLDLRGILPRVEELDAVEQDPSLLATYRDAYLEDPHLEDALVERLAERWHTRVDVFSGEWYDFGLTERDEFLFEKSVGEEPLRLIARTIVEDRPYGEIVTSDKVVANEMLGSIWPIDRPEGSGWVESTWTDGRPAAGILASNGLWWRYDTDAFNQNRARAAAIFRLLICEDFLARPVSLDAAVGSDPETAIRSEPACQACHSAIEPVAAGLFGFWVESQHSAAELSSYHAEREQWGVDALDVELAWFGQPYYGLDDLGGLIAQDARFDRCAVESWSESLWRRPVSESDFDRLSELQAAYDGDGGRVKALLRAITDDEVYRAGGLSRPTPAEEQTTRMVAIHQLASASAELSGFAWLDEGIDHLAEDGRGFRILGGGVNGTSVTGPQRDPGLTWVLVTQRLAQGTASDLVRRELLNGDRLLFTHATLETTPEDEAFDAELAHLRWALTARRADADVVAADRALWVAVESADGAEAAWRSVLEAILRDPEYVSL
ncbi:MAG: hypothetical protein GY913_20155 [Proteobacteria bacterium]|nr:hypothetical protein [Pseudomonadota bacterium]MCP4919220.1 hypothetical protein [Pseudomonadota bacterium]